ncbi:HNH endonuclease signature motif containing protein [Streptomyces sp. C10-9-1]|uniref:HNH endonuclease signature motif containing protein n=1 Tax=Streptomyces sp. C10-9-1 TaxID=1859285 RepID=UPI003D7028F7
MAGRYTEQVLRRAAREAGDWDEAVRACGGTPSPGTRRYVRRRMAALGIDTSHVRTPGARHTEARLRELVALSSSIGEVVRRLGLSPVGGNHTHVSRRIVSMGIDTSHFTPSRRPSTRRARGPVLSLRDPSSGRVPGRRLRALLLADGVADRCAECGTGPWWNGKPLRLEVDHLDGCWWDNRRENLRLLCPNCHATTDTYRGRKRGATRWG